MCMISLDSVKTKYLFFVLWCRQGFIGLKANLQLHSHSLTSAHFSPSFSCGKNNKQSGHCWYCGAFPLFPSSAGSQGGNLQPFQLQTFCSSHSRSAPKRVTQKCRLPGQLGQLAPSPVTDPCLGFPDFFFLSICQVSALGQRV